MDPLNERRRHSAAHVLAMAVLRLFPGTRLGIGPVTAEGFYHDFELPQPLTWNDVQRIEEEMNLIIQADLPFNRIQVPREQAFEITLTRGQIYKSELLQEITDPEISFFKTGEEFVDLCRGPHIASTNEIGAIKLLALGEARWKNEPSRPLMQRISGVAFATPRELSQYLTRHQQIQSRDFRKYAEDRELTYTLESGVGFTPSGFTALNSIEKVIREELNKYEFEEMYLPAGTQTKEVVGGFSTYFTLKNRSYRALPIRLLARNRHQLNVPQHLMGKQYQVNESLVVTSYYPNDASSGELRKTITSIIQITKKLELNIHAQIHLSDIELPALRNISDLLNQQGVSQTQVVNAHTPKQDIYIKIVATDSLKRDWELIDMLLHLKGPQYVSSDGHFEECSQLITYYHLERMLYYYLEDMEGGLPYWAAPVQALIIPITEKQENYAEHLRSILVEQGARTAVDDRAESLPARIRDAELAKIPIILIAGEKEESSRAVSVRLSNTGEIGLVGMDKLWETLETKLSDFSGA